ncbi:MAG: hypothetical protein KAY24_18890, partial [Candidatus Eisenbacteria sp.]|nr:hypothetical protein [Candidatus Eisenbacteria bacterium]
MKRHFAGMMLLGFIALAVCTTWPAQAAWLAFDQDAPPGEPEVSVLADTPALLHLQVNVPGMWAEDRQTPEGLDSYVEIPGHGHTLPIGSPAVPVVRFIVEIPCGAELYPQAVAGAGQVYDMGSHVLRERLYPVQPAVEKDRDRYDPGSFQRDADAYLRSSAIPEGLVSVREIGELRGHRLALVEVKPVAYEPVEGSLLCHSRIDVMISMSGAEIERTQAVINHYYSPPFDRLLNCVSANHHSFLGGRRDLPVLPIGLLIITADQFESALDPLVEWKTKKGYYTTVATLSQTGSTKEEITDFIEDAYNTWPVPPTWVLLVGDTNLIPYYTGPGSGTATDLYFGTITGGDYLPEVYLGRFPARTTAHVNTMVEKVVDFEKLMLSNGVEFTNWATWIASDDMGAMAEGTHNYVIENYFPPEMNHTKIYERLGGSTQDITNALNDGTVIVNYSGHGSTTSWGCVPFNQNNVRNLNNLDMYPFVISNACVTGTYNNTECYGETWVIEPEKGATSFWGASAGTYWDEDDILEKRLWQAFWEQECYDLGSMTNAALYGVYIHYGGGGLSHHYYDCYNIMGDPSMDLWATIPNSLEADYLPVFLIGMTEFTATVTENGVPVENALVCIYMPGEVYAAAYTNAAGEAVIEVDPTPQSVGTMFVTVTKHDHEPHFGSVQVMPASGPFLVFESCTVDDDQLGESCGNGDGAADSGETLELVVTLENVGVDPAVDVSATLTADDPFITILDDTEDFGTIPA